MLVAIISGLYDGASAPPPDITQSFHFFRVNVSNIIYNRPMAASNSMIILAVKAGNVSYATLYTNK